MNPLGFVVTSSALRCDGPTRPTLERDHFALVIRIRSRTGTACDLRDVHRDWSASPVVYRWTAHLGIGREQVASIEGRWDSVHSALRLWGTDNVHRESPDVWTIANGKLVQRSSRFIERPDAAPALRHLEVVDPR